MYTSFITVHNKNRSIVTPSLILDSNHIEATGSHLTTEVNQCQAESSAWVIICE